MYRKQAPVVLLLATLLVALPLLSASASVGLSYFKAEPTAANTIMLTWETATEENTIGFKLYRSTTESPSDWGAEIHSEGAQGSAQTGWLYTYEDHDITPGVRYYYLLREVTSNNTLADLMTASAGVGLATDTPTPSYAPTSTYTPRPPATARVTPTFTIIAPTATPKYTVAPATAIPGTLTPAPPATLTPYRAPTATPLPPAQVSTPIGHTPVATMPAVAPVSTSTPAVLTPMQPETLTPELIAAEEAPRETATPRPTKDVTPVIFAAETQGKGSPTPQTTDQTAGQGSSGSLAVVIGGSVVGLAALLAAVILFLRSRRS